MVGSSGEIALADGGHSTGSPHGEGCRLVDKTSDLDEVKEDGRVNRPGPRGVVVGIRDDLENLGGQLEPWTMERRYVPPMSGVSVSVVGRREGLDGKRETKGRELVQHGLFSTTNGKRM